MMKSRRKVQNPSVVDFAGRREFLAAIGSSALSADVAALPWTAECGGCSTPALAATKRSKLSVAVVQRIRVTRGPERHRAFPGLLRLKDGTLLIFYREGTDHWRTPGSVVKLARSTDGGATWSEPWTVLQQKDGVGYAAHHGPLQLSDGSILTGGTSWQYKDGRGPMFGARAYALRSHDGGRTWDVQQIGPKPGFVWQNQYGRVMEIDGKLWLPGGGQREGQKRSHSGYFVSHDNGKTWPGWQALCQATQNERDTLGLPDGRLLVMVRDDGKETRRLYSSDRGKTWTKKEKLDLFGQCPSLLLLPSGNILFAYRQVRPKAPKGVGLAVSCDNGQTWRELDPLYVSPNGSFDCAYPSMVLNESGDVLCAYYTTFDKGDCHIELARIKVVEGE